MTTRHAESAALPHLSPFCALPAPRAACPVAPPHWGRGVCRSPRESSGRRIEPLRKRDPCPSAQTDEIPRRIASSLNYSKLARELEDNFKLSGGDKVEGLLTKEEKAYRKLGFHFFLLIRTLGR